MTQIGRFLRGCSRSLLIISELTSNFLSIFVTLIDYISWIDSTAWLNKLSNRTCRKYHKIAIGLQ